MTLSFDGDGQTPLDAEDLEGLIPTWVTTRADLNEVEQANIAAARDRWMRRRSPDMLDDHELRRLHTDMFCDVWRWAGRQRTRETNIGVEPSRIAVDLRTLVGDTRFWLETDANSAVARFHHRLVQIHVFPNGNGRHGRLAADLLAKTNGLPPPRWGSDRKAYLDPLRHADTTGDITPLRQHMWST
nr:mobile mystery protein B [Euzebya pacifica]